MKLTVQTPAARLGGVDLDGRLAAKGHKHAELVQQHREERAALLTDIGKQHDGLERGRLHVRHLRGNFGVGKKRLNGDF